MLIRKIVEITDNREKAKEIAQRVIRRGNEEGQKVRWYSPRGTR